MATEPEPTCDRCGERCGQTWLRMPSGVVICFGCATDEELTPLFEGGE